MTAAGADPGAHPGTATAASGTPVAVDLTRDRRARRLWLLLLAGPVLWFTHFMVVYLIAEAGCTGSGTGLRLFDPPVPRRATIVATAAAVALCLLDAWRCLRWWQRLRAAPPGDVTEAGAVDVFGRFDTDPGAPLAYAGFLLAVISAVAVLFVGVPTAFLPSC